MILIKFMIQDPDPDSEDFSNDEGNPDVVDDQYIRVISQRAKKQAKRNARGRGPLNL